MIDPTNITHATLIIGVGLAVMLLLVMMALTASLFDGLSREVKALAHEVSDLRAYIYRNIPKKQRGNGLLGPPPDYEPPGRYDS